MAAEVTKPSPQWVRETLCEDLADVDRKRGRLPDSAAIERAVSGDIQAFQAQEREAKPQRRPGNSKGKLTRDGLDKARPAQDLAAKLGYELYKRKPKRERPRQLTCICNGGRCKRCRLFIRINELVGLRPHTIGHKQTRKLDYKYPRFAPLIIEETTLCNMGLRQYQGITAQQRNRMLLRAMESFADQSNGIPGLGAWWIK